MNTLIETTTDYLLHSAFTTLFFDAWLKSLAVLAVAGGPVLSAAASGGGDPALDLVSGGSQLAVSAAPGRCAARLATPALVGLDRASMPATSSRSRSTLRPAARPRLPPRPPRLRAHWPPRLARITRGAVSPSPRASAPPGWSVAVAIWLVGAALGLASMLAGQVQLRRLARSGRFLQDPDWTLLLRDTCERLRLRRPVRLLQSTTTRCR